MIKKISVLIGLGLAISACSASKTQLKATNQADEATHNHLLTNSIAMPAMHRTNGTATYFSMKDTLILLKNDTAQIQKQ